jgi:hypothetical protein
MRPLFIIIAFLTLNVAKAQVTISNRGTNLTITNGTNITIIGSYTNTLSATGLSGNMENSGDINVTGDWINNCSNYNFTTTSGTVKFTGNNSQTISGSQPTNFPNLVIDKQSNHVTVNNNDNKILNNLSLQRGKIILGTNNLILGPNAEVTGTPGQASYIQADGTGTLAKQFNRIESFTFPIGTASHYASFTISLTDASFTGSDFIYTGTSEGTPPYLTGDDYINRHWTINSQGFSNIAYNVSYNYRQSDIVGNEQNLSTAFYDGIVWNEVGNVDTASNSLSSSSAITSAPNNIVFSGVKAASALPIELIYFKALPLNQCVKLEWSTASESNNDYFTIERSRDGRNFYPIGKVKGAGNSLRELPYQYLDESPYSGTSYYRLRQTDYDGKFSFSDIVAVNYFGHKAPLAYYQAGTGSIVAQNIGSDAGIIEVYSVSGALVHIEIISPGVEKTVIHAGNLPKGLYISRITTGTATYTSKITTY